MNMTLFKISLLIGLLLSASPALSQGPKELNREFRTIVEERLSKAGTSLNDVCPIDSDLAARRIFYDYGAIFVAVTGNPPPSRCIFSSQTELDAYLKGIEMRTVRFGGAEITLQKPAMQALLNAIGAAGERGIRITPRGGQIAGSRSYDDTARLWESRFTPALRYWKKRGKITAREAEAASQLPIREQVTRVLEWEKDGIYFSTGFDKSILYSVAAPGASQHVFGLALDIRQFASSPVRKILAQHGWYQTVVSDLPHFTYLGESEYGLPALGLKKVSQGQYDFWVPKED